MPSLPSLRLYPREGVWRSIRKHLNFYRIHIIFFTFTPLVFSGIFYASNQQYQISFIDALFNCVSAMTVCGLATVDISSLTGWQQGILFIQMCLGSPVVVSWVMVYIRKHYFAKKFEHIIKATTARKAAMAVAEAENDSVAWPRQIVTLLRRGTGLSVVAEEGREDSRDKEPKGLIYKVRPDMIRRMDDAPKLVNPSGWVSEGRTVPMKRVSTIQSLQETNRHLSIAGTSSSPERPVEAALRRASGSSVVSGQSPFRRLSDPGMPSRRSSITSAPMKRFETVNIGQQNFVPPAFAPTQTVEFAPSVLRRRERPEHSHMSDFDTARPGTDPATSEKRRSIPRTSLPHVSLTTHLTTRSHRSMRQTKHSGFGGFPMPYEILSSLFGRFFPKLQRKLTRTVTIPVTTTITSQRDNVPAGAQPVPYITFDAVVGRNSTFHLLTNEQLEELGGVEYRALNALLWIVAGYHIGIQVIAFIVIAPYMSMNRWREDFLPPNLHKPLPAAWFSLFQVVSSYTNTGMSLVDQSMVPFQQAYPMIVFMMVLILAGNTAFPIFLRLTIWILYKLVPRRSRSSETLHFLLDHPRRCFIYLFPSHQTWFLVVIIITLNCTDWFFFMILDIGTPAIESIPLGVRFIIGLLQATAVRAAGFGTVALSALAPAVKVLYVIMMYISVYPIALSVRSTNVYEEQSLGIFGDDEGSDDEDEFQPTGPRVTVLSRYLAMHARRQLAFDMWWLGLALFLVCIVERRNIDDAEKFGWFNIFSIVFELVSAYGTVGLSLGIPTANYSFSGAFRPLSKLIVCFVMIRGRHRGLPVAIDRAVLLPAEFHRRDEYVDDASQHQSQASDTPYTNGDTTNEKRNDDDTLEWRRHLSAGRRITEEIFVEDSRRRSAEEDFR